MSGIYEIPPILSGSAENQLRQLRDYLVRMARDTGHGQSAAETTAVPSTAGITRVSRGGAPPQTAAQSVEDARKRADALRALIVKTAKQQQADKEELELKIEGIDGTFFYIRYSPVARPTREQMTSAPQEDTAYMGVCSTNQDSAPEDPQEYVWSLIKGDNALTVQIQSSHGSIFKNGQISTVLSARVYDGEKEITDELDDNAFLWTRATRDWEADARWNADHAGGTKSITITDADVYKQATFFCDLVDPDDLENETRQIRLLRRLAAM